jgi:hypothetical protein
LQAEKAVIPLEFFTTLVVAGNSSDSICIRMSEITLNGRQKGTLSSEMLFDEE